MKYIYPAIFTEEEDGILVDFPDLPNCYTDGANLEEAFENAEDALALALWHLEEECADIPVPSAPATLTVPKSASVALVRTDTLPVRQMNDMRTVRKNVTLPGWMDTLAREHNINFSKLLQNAIRKECGIGV
ncbi:antitoxin HicB [Selenomonas sp. oral taxon 126]|uniref:type II toxin-antitoxin system HicB family antitoxin n=1 Tax=Selenomonas sp. oral taxon 126 TaxID=712528 RepID=UPI0008079574|nr:type II toxin-antitoxin system HicB family antitoxin [Selenomonas sp. oral taxon 126]ANR70309.1 antitoxin HicB [Selenomonas sp. oral taxon 126]